MPMMPPVKFNADGAKNYLKKCGILFLAIGFLLLTGIGTEYLVYNALGEPFVGLGLILGMFGYSFLYGLVYFSFFSRGIK